MTSYVEFIMMNWHCVPEGLPNMVAIYIASMIGKTSGLIGMKIHQAICLMYFHTITLA